MTTLSRKLARFTCSLRFHGIPGEVAEVAKLQLLDTLGCGLAAHALGVATAPREVMQEIGGTPESTVIGSAVPLPAPNAAFSNASLCHGLDFDNTHPASVSHASVVTCPAALAAAEAAGSTGRELLVAIIVGNEVTAQIGMAVTGEFHARGLHATPICGVFGAAAAVARLTGLSLSATVNALGIAGSMASGLLAYLQDGSSTKQIHPGWAAHGAIIAARLAKKGATGPARVLEGRFGLYSALLDRPETTLPDIGQLGQRWETLHVATKLYPSCHYMHGVLGAVSQVADPKLQPSSIEDVVASVPSEVVPIVLEPADQKAKPLTPYDAKFSLQYSVASLLVHGAVTPATYADDALHDEVVLDLAKRVRYEVRDFPSYGAAFPGGVAIRTTSGDTYKAELAYEPGSTANPLPPSTVRDKFRQNASLALGRTDVEAAEAAVLQLEKENKLGVGFAALNRC